MTNLSAKISESAAAPTASTETCAQQCGAVCWRMHRGKVEVLLITSRDTGRWVIPKGWPMTGLSAATSAAREAWEEAGVEGEVADQPLGEFHYDKVLQKKAPLACSVTVYGLRVMGLKDRFPEAKQRRRKWFPAGKAARKVFEPELRALLQALDEGAIVPDAPPKALL